MGVLDYAPEFIEVRDQYAPDLLLGYYPKPKGPNTGFFTVAFIPHKALPAHFDGAEIQDQTLPLRRVEFRVSYLSVDDGWTMKVVLMTAAPLETLRKMPNFVEAERL